MILNKGDFDRLVNEAWAHDFSGWDFGYLAGRMVEHPLPWDYRQLVTAKMRQAGSMLDMDTGGGELLASLQPLPPQTCACEGYAPNVPIARARLEPLGVRVIGQQGAGVLPFDDGTFDLVTNRHGGYWVAELERILKQHGGFITQQVGGRNCIRLNEMLQDEVYFQYAYWTLDYALRQFEGSGFEIVDQREAYPEVDFHDIGAVVYLLKAVSWQVDDFSIETYREKLGGIHNIIQETGKFTVLAHRFYIEARKK